MAEGLEVYLLFNEINLQGIYPAKGTIYRRKSIVLDALTVLGLSREGLSEFAAGMWAHQSAVNAFTALSRRAGDRGV